MVAAQRKSIEPYIPDDVEYYQHQADGIRRMIRMRSVLLADDMGLGKSLQAISLFAIDVFQGYSDKCLVICPASLKTNWENEFKKFTRDISIQVIRTTTGVSATKAHKRKLIEEFKNAHGPRVLITNYEQISGMLDEYKSVRWDMIIFDEAHMIKNPKAKRTRACHALSTRRALLLTGSPVLNHVNDLWALLFRIAPNSMESYYKFVNRYAVFGGWQDKQITGVKNERELNSRLQDIMVRRLKEDVLDLPEVVYTTRIVELANNQQKLYKEVITNMQLTDRDGEIEDIDNQLTKYLRLKQICGTTKTFMDKDESGKLDSAEWDAEDIIINSGERVVAFTQFRSVQDAFVERMTKIANSMTGGKGPRFPIYVLNGDIPIDDRQGIVDEWSKSDRPGLIVCMFQVAGIGLNMTSSRYGLFLDKLVVPSLNKQAVDRMHRIGADRTQPVTIIEYLAKDTVEERVEEILKQKKKVSKQLLEDDEVNKLAIKQALLEEKKKNA